MNSKILQLETTVKTKIEMTKTYDGSYMQANTNLIREYKENVKHVIKFVEATSNDTYTLMVLKSFEKGISFDMNTIQKEILIRFVERWLNMLINELKECTKWV